MKSRPGLELMAFDPHAFRHVIMAGRQVSERAEFANAPHLHPEILELHLVSRGQISLLIDGHYHALYGGDILLIQPDTPHGTVEEPLGRCERLWLQIRVPASGAAALGLNPDETREVFDRLRRVPTRTFRTDNVLVPIFDRIRDVFADGQEPLRSINLRNLVLRVVLDCLALTERSESNLVSAGIETALEIIRNSQGSVSPVELARAAGMSESAFKLQFKKQTGHPPVEYATRHRIETARRLLHATKKSVTEVAHELGFSSSQLFATVFRRYTGMTPNEFRSGASALQWSMEPMIGFGASFNPLIRLGKPR